MGRQQGFTLIELLLVLALLAVTSVAVIATLPGNSQDEAKQYAQSFYQRLLLLNEEAILGGRDFGLTVDEEKKQYRWLQLDDQGWQLLDMDSIPATTEIDDELTLTLTMGAGVWQDDDRLFEPGSLFDEDMFAEQEQKSLPPPDILVASSGEITPFTLAIYPQQGDSVQDGWRLTAYENGQITLLKPGELDEE
ncbi:type II secretion system minor pseudopilin GspH [Vibrio sp.]|uniref:type II secretion system minor pseudopilin GspH n=1 Tax=Vibrio sp. TaxID=678 RepID=UPI003D0BE33A